MLSIASNKRYLIIAAWLLIAPVLLLRVFTSLYPMIMTFIYGFQDYNLISRTQQFNGVENYKRLLTDDSIITTLNFSFVFTCISILLHVVIGVCLALLMNVTFKGRKFLRTIMLLPWATPLIVAGIAATWMFNTDYGIINDILYRLFEIRPKWFVEVDLARTAVITTDVWKDTSFMAILILAGLQTIPHEIYESARIDGANKWGIFWRITLPHIKRLLVILVVYFSLWRLTQFELIYAMTSGGPGSSTSLLSYRIYLEAFKNLDYGYASSISVALFLLMVVISAIGFYTARRME